MSHVDALQGFVDVVVDATGQEISVPAHWVGDPMLGRGIHVVEPEPAPEEVDVEDAGEMPTRRSTTAELEAYAERAGIDLGEASTNAERFEVIEAAVAAAQAAEQEEQPAGDPDVQLVAGTEAEGPLVPAARAAQAAAESTQETTTDPAAGEENQS